MYPRAPHFAATDRQRPRLGLMRRRAAAALAALALACWAAPRPALADDDRFAPPPVSAIGAATLPEGEHALVVSAGVPDVEVGALVGLSSLADVMGRVRFQYGRGVRIGGGGLTAGATLRLALADFGGWRLALTSDPELLLHLLGHDHPPTTVAGSVAFGATPLSGGLVLDRMLLPDVRLILAVQAGVGFFLAPDTTLYLPLSAAIGAEIRLAEQLWIFTRLDSGVDVYGPGAVGSTRALLRARVGFSIAR